MLKTKQRRFAVVAILVFSMMAMYGGMPAVNADSMNSAKVTLSDSDRGATATSTVVFNLGTGITETQYININFDANFTDILEQNVTCPLNTTKSVTGNDVRCTVDATFNLAADTNHTVEVGSITNPDEGLDADYSIIISSHQAGGTEIESTETKVYIIDDVTVTAHVAASLTFAIAPVASGASVNGDTTTAESATTSIAFGTLEPDTAKVMAQKLMVSTNAADGFSVTVQQDSNMMSDAGADIDSFTTAVPAVWSAPSGTLSDETTFGHMGVATDDDSYAAFDSNFYQGLDAATPLPVMTHNGPADGSTPGAGLANVAYKVQITDLQEAGDYENTLTYVCTPTF